MNRFSKAPRGNFEFGCKLSYFSLFLTDNLTIANFLHYPQTFEWTKFLTSNMFSQAPRGQIKLWSSLCDLVWIEIALLYFYMLMLFDELRCYKLKLLKCKVSNQNIVPLIFLTFSFKSSWHIIAIPRSSRLEVFCKKVVLKHFAKFRGKHRCQSPFFWKIAGRLLQKRDCRTCIFL